MDRVEREETRVLFVRSGDSLRGIKAAWEDLESRFDSLRGRKFVGAFYPRTEEYRACVEIRDTDEPELLGLEQDTLPGGSYARIRLRGEPPEVYERIGPAFDELEREAEGDDARPSLEVYRRRDEIDCLLPVR